MALRRDPAEQFLADFAGVLWDWLKKLLKFCWWVFKEGSWVFREAIPPQKRRGGW